MLITFSSKCRQKIQKIKKKNSSLYKKIEKQLILFEENPSHPSLRLHKLLGGQRNMWSISVGRSFRLVYEKDNNEVTFLNCGTHKEVYEK